MSDVIPIRVVIDGSSNTTGLSEFLTGETLGLLHGGTGATTAAAARTNLGLASVAASGSYTDLINTPNTDGIPEGSSNLYFTDERVDDRVANLFVDGVGIQKTYDDAGNLLNIAIDFSEFDTDDITEGAVNTFLASRTTDNIPEGSSNLYFQNERVDDRVAALIQGGEDISVVYDDVNNTLTIALASSVDGIDLSNNNTDDLSEGSSNLYFTDSRADVRVNAQTGSNLDLSQKSTTELAEGTNLYYTNARSDARVNLQTGASLDLSQKSTTELAEGTNLYYTNFRADQRVNLQTGTNLDLTSKNTDNLSEGSSNLYFTNSRVRSEITSSDLDMGGNKVLFGNLYSQLADLPSASTYHGMFAHVHATGKAYFAHAGNWIELGNKSDIDTAIANLVDTAPTTLDTLNELAAALGDDANFSTTITNSIATKLSSSDFNSTFDTNFSNKSTSDLSEGTNLYYTDARVQNKLASVSGHIIPDTDITYDLGSSSNKFRDLYLSGSSIILGSIELSETSGTFQITPAGGGSTETFATQSFVTTAVSNLVDSAPGTLDTLNELAAALGDDANFSTTVTNSIATKLPLSGGTMSGDIDGNGNKVLFANVYQNISDLPSATTYHGMFAHVHATGKGYFAHAGNWVELANNSQIFDGDYNSLTNTPTIPSTTDQITEASNLYYTDARVDTRIANAGLFDGQFSSLSGTPTTVSGYGITDAVTSATVGGIVTQQVAAQIGNIQSDLDDEIFDRENADTALQNQINSIVTYSSTNFDTDFSNKSTSDLSEGTNLYYTEARFDARLGTKSTSDLSEGSNLYFTNERVDDRVSSLITAGVNVATTYDDAAGTLEIRVPFENIDDRVANILTAGTGIGIVYDDPAGTITISNTLSGYSSSDFNTDFAQKSTSSLSEGTNLYYTDARVDARITNAGSVTQSDIDTAIANLVDSAPGTLNTLNELAAALGDDANFSTTVTNSIASKLPLSGGTMSGDIDGNGNKVLFANMYATIGDLPNATTYHGMFAHVHATGKAYFAHAGNWIELANNSQIFNGDYNSLTNLPTLYTSTNFNTDFGNKSTDNLSEGSTNLYYTDARVDARITNAGTFDGQFSSLTGTPTTLAGYGITDSVVTTSNVNGIVTQQVAAQVGNIQSDLDDEIFDRENADTALQNQINNLSSFTNSDFDTRLATKTTDDLSEGTNLYYTDARVQTKLGSVSGHIIPDTDVTYDLGSSTNKFRDLYLSGSSIVLGDVVLTSHSGQLRVHSTGGGTPSEFATESFVTTAISNLVDSAPGALDTLNELAAALGDDANFSTTIANSIGNKLATSDFTNTANTWLSTKSTSNLSEGTNLYYTEARFDARLGTKSTSDLSEGTNLYYTNTRVRTEITGAELDMGSNDITTTGKIKFANVYSQLSDLPSATTYHGMFAHVHATGKAYFAHAGNWIELANNSQIFNGDYNSLSNKPTIPSAYTDSSVDTHLNTSSATTGQSLIWNGSDYSWSTPAAGGASVTTSDTAPASPSDGDMWFDTSDLKTYVYYNDGSSSQWVQANPTGAVVTDLSQATTDDLSEGSTNLYYTNSRVDARITASNPFDGAYSSLTGAPTLYASSNFNTDFSNKSTSDLSEGTNLYYTEARFDARLGTKSTSDLSEGTNLYYTDARVQTYLTSQGIATQVDVNNAISNLVDSSPTTLDTLNELAAALGDDANFSTTISNLIGTKLATSDFTSTANTWLSTKSTSDLSEGTNLYYTESRFDTRLGTKSTDDLSEGSTNLYYTEARFDTRLGTKSTTDLSEGTNLYYTDARVRTEITGSTLDMGSSDITTTGKIKFANVYSQLGDLPSATTYHGMFAHVHATGKAYFAHAGAWVELANNSQIFDGDYNSLSNKPTIPSAYTDSSVDTHLNTSSASSSQVLSWNGSDYAWVAQSGGGGGGGASVSVSDSAPSSPSAGDLWFNSSDTKMYVYYNDGSSSQWVQTNPTGSTGGGGGSSVTVSTSAPSSPSEGDMWFDSRYAVLLVYYGTQWVNVSGEADEENTPSWTEVTNHTATAGDKLFVDCSSSAVNVTLPASPSMGDEIRIIDATGNASTNNITIVRNGNNIQGVAQNLTIDTTRAAFGLVYYNSTQGWILMER